MAFRELSGGRDGTSSASMREEVMSARRRQAARFGRTHGLARCNADMPHRQVRQHCRLDVSSSELLRASMDELGLSARAHDKILRVTRTIADLAESDTIRPEHLTEAINYRMLDRQMWT